MFETILEIAGSVSIISLAVLAVMVCVYASTTLYRDIIENINDIRGGER